MSSQVSTTAEDDQLTGNMALQTNQMTIAYAERFYNDFCEMFEITGNGSLRATRDRLMRIEQWFNRTYLIISLISGVPLNEVRFNYGLGRGSIGNTNENRVTLIHIYAISYSVLLRMAATLGRQVPAQFTPVISNIDEADATH